MTIGRLDKRTPEERTWQGDPGPHPSAERLVRIVTAMLREALAYEAGEGVA